MHIVNQRLAADKAEHHDSPNRGSSYGPGDLDTIILHYTAGGSAKSAIGTLCDPERAVSAHLVVGRDGAIAQLLPFDTIGWHAGQSQWGERVGLNRYSLGIEIENAGQLEETNGQFVSWFGRSYPSSEVVYGVHRHQARATCWHTYTDLQLEIVEALCVLLVAEYGIHHILGHEEVSPRRKIDPGPAFPLDRLRARVQPPPMSALQVAPPTLETNPTEAR